MFGRTVCVAFVLSLLIGCGSDPTAGLGDPVDISGTIKVDGKPLADREIEFNAAGGKIPAEFSRFTAKTGADGSYSVQQMYPATYTLSVSGKAPEPNPDGSMPAAAEDPLVRITAEKPPELVVDADKTTHDINISTSE